MISWECAHLYRKVCSSLGLILSITKCFITQLIDHSSVFLVILSKSLLLSKFNPSLQHVPFLKKVNTYIQCSIYLLGIRFCSCAIILFRILLCWLATQLQGCLAFDYSASTLIFLISSDIFSVRFCRIWVFQEHIHDALVETPVLFLLLLSATYSQ